MRGLEPPLISLSLEHLPWWFGHLGSPGFESELTTTLVSCNSVSPSLSGMGRDAGCESWLWDLWGCLWKGFARHLARSGYPVAPSYYSSLALLSSGGSYADTPEHRRGCAGEETNTTARQLKPKHKGNQGSLRGSLFLSWVIVKVRDQGDWKKLGWILGGEFPSSLPACWSLWRVLTWGGEDPACLVFLCWLWLIPVRNQVSLLEEYHSSGVKEWVCRWQTGVGWQETFCGLSIMSVPVKFPGQFISWMSKDVFLPDTLLLRHK